MSEKFWITFWVAMACIIAGATGFAVANGEPWYPFARGVMFAWAIQQLGLHVRQGGEES